MAKLIINLLFYCDFKSRDYCYLSKVGITNQTEGKVGFQFIVAPVNFSAKITLGRPSTITQANFSSNIAPPPWRSDALASMAMISI